uniref:Uncharacterized protein n=1 Tax=Sipha flava TaxID=143950 RepID=A0A2S2QXG4_9HEMI
MNTIEKCVPVFNMYVTNNINGRIKIPARIGIHTHTPLYVRRYTYSNINKLVFIIILGFFVMSTRYFFPFLRIHITTSIYVHKTLDSSRPVGFHCISTGPRKIENAIRTRVLYTLI